MQEEWKLPYRDIIVILHEGTGEHHGNVGQDGRRNNRDSKQKPRPLKVLTNYYYNKPSTTGKLT